MEQRRLRLGDILDDYCPRERRLTNHAIVAMIEDDIKQTRCTTCDAEHPYKGGKTPRRRKAEAPSLYKEVLAGLTDADAPPVLAASQESEPAGAIVAPAAEVEDTEARAQSEPQPAAEAPEQPAASDLEEGPVHRPLIRATLPRPEGQKDSRPLPEFTVRQTGGRGNGHFRGGDLRSRQRGGQGGANGNRAHGGSRFAGARQGPGRGQSGRGPGGGFRSAHQPRHGGKKRSR